MGAMKSGTEIRAEILRIGWKPEKLAEFVIRVRNEALRASECPNLRRRPDYLKARVSGLTTH